MQFGSFFSLNHYRLLSSVTYPDMQVCHFLHLWLRHLWDNWPWQLGRPSMVTLSAPAKLPRQSRVNPRITYRTPSRFSAISSKPFDGSARNLRYSQRHQFDTLCLNFNFIATIVWPEMTSEWRHVGRFWCKILNYGKRSQKLSFKARSDFIASVDYKYT